LEQLQDFAPLSCQRKKTKCVYANLSLATICRLERKIGSLPAAAGKKIMLTWQANIGSRGELQHVLRGKIRRSRIKISKQDNWQCSTVKPKIHGRARLAENYSSISKETKEHGYEIRKATLLKKRYILAVRGRLAPKCVSNKSRSTGDSVVFCFEACPK